MTSSAKTPIYRWALVTPKTADGLMELVRSYLVLHEEYQKLKRKSDEVKDIHIGREGMLFDGEVYFREKNGDKDGLFVSAVLTLMES